MAAAVSLTAGSVRLILFTVNGERTNDTATFTWRSGTTLDFLENALKRHALNLAKARCLPSMSIELDNLYFADPATDLSVSLDFHQVLNGVVKNVAIIPLKTPTLQTHINLQNESNSNTYESSVKISSKPAAIPPSNSNKTSFLQPPNTSIGQRCRPYNNDDDEDIRMPKGTAGRSQTRFMELMTANKTNTGGMSSNIKIPWSEVQRHNKPDDCWVVLNGKVYDITGYLNFHPGGKKILTACAGTDVTEKFNKYHPWVNGSLILQNNVVGTVVGNPYLLAPLKEDGDV